MSLKSTSVSDENAHSSQVTADLNKQDVTFSPKRERGKTSHILKTQDTHWKEDLKQGQPPPPEN